jgi:hypothetical protein
MLADGLRYFTHMKTHLFVILTLLVTSLSAQVSWRVVGGWGVGITENRALDVDPAAAWLGRATVSGYLPVPGFRYNLGVEYGEDVWGQRPAVQGGIALVWLNPSGFLKAMTAEDVTYSSIPWFISTDINSFHAAVPYEDTWLYGWGIEPAIVAGRTLSKNMLLTGSVSYRFNYCAPYAQFGTVTSYSGLFLHLGLSFTRGRRFYKP